MKFIDFLTLSNKELGKYIRSCGFSTCNQLPYTGEQFLEKIHIELDDDIKLNNSYCIHGSNYSLTFNFTYQNIPCNVTINGSGKCSMKWEFIKSAYYAVLFKKENYLWYNKNKSNVYAKVEYYFPLELFVNDVFGDNYNSPKEVLDVYLPIAKELHNICENVVVFFENYPEYHKLALKYFDFDFSQYKNFGDILGIKYHLPNFYAFVNAKYNLKNHFNIDLSYAELFALYKAFQKNPEYKIIDQLFVYNYKFPYNITIDLLNKAIKDNEYDLDFNKPKWSDYLYEINMEYYKAKQEIKKQLIAKGIDEKLLVEFFNGNKDFFRNYSVPDNFKNNYR